MAQAKPGKDLYLDAEPDEKSYDPMYAAEASEIKRELEKEDQEKEIGSSEYFEEPVQKESRRVSEKSTVVPLPDQPRERKTAQATIKKTDAKDSQISEIAEKSEEKSRIKMSDIVMGVAQSKKKKVKSQPKTSQPLAGENKQDENILFSDSFSRNYPTENSVPGTASKVSIKKADKFFRGSRKMKKDFEIARVSGGAKKFFVFFAGIFILLAVLAAAYFFFPKATLTLQLKNQEKSATLDLTATEQISEINTADKTLPAKFEQITKEFTEDFDSTGSKDGGAKATGQAVIYNEFSGENQPLVATTRLQTDDGKIFRITKNVVVPGMTNIGGETKPGAIEVEIIADQPGESYNIIDPTSFKIPGFQDTPAKYEKFYA